MSDTLSIRAVAKRLKTATTFAAVFGTLPSGDSKVQRSHIRKQFGYLAALVHPDHAPKDASAEASEAFRLLNELRHAAEKAIEYKNYDKPITPKEADQSDSELVTAKGIYRLQPTVFAQGDFSILYRGVFVGKDPIQILAKVAREPTKNAWLEKEAVLLRKVGEAKARTPLFLVSPFFPTLLDTVLVDGAKGTRYRANLYRFAPGFVSLSDIIKAYPNGLEPAQAAWIGRRVLAQTLAASTAGVVHGAITPDHVLVHPTTHDPLHIGWAHAIERGYITHVVDRWKDIYPPEVFDKKEADHRTDIYMAAATIVKLLGGDVKRKSLPKSVPAEMARTILRGIEASPSRRPQDGKLYLDEFTRVVRGTWGKVYRPLTLPGH